MERQVVPQAARLLFRRSHLLPNRLLFGTPDYTLATLHFSDEIHVLCILVRGANFSVQFVIVVKKVVTLTHVSTLQDISSSPHNQKLLQGVIQHEFRTWTVISTLFLHV